MRAVRFTADTTLLSIGEVERPTPGPGEVLTTVAGAGACRSDVAGCEAFERGRPDAVAPAFTPGDETRGSVEELGHGRATPDRAAA